MGMLSLVVWALAASALGGAAADWPGWRGPRRDGKSPETGLLKQWPEGGPERLWQADGIGKGFSTVAVTGGMVFTTGDIDGRLRIFAFDLAGKPKWRTDVDAAWTRSHPGARSTPMIDEGLLYVVSGNGVVACLDAKTGRKRWSRQMSEFGGGTPGWGYAETPLIFRDSAIVCPGGRKCIVALDKKTGKTQWTSRGYSGAAQYGSSIIVPFGRGNVVVTGTRAGIVGVNARNGAFLWSNSWSANNTANCPTPAYSGAYVFWANGYGKGGVCLKLERSGDGLAARQAWTTRDMNCHHGGYIIHEGYIYGNNGGGWACLELKSGRKMWEERGVGKGSVCFADGMLYLFGESGGRAGLATCSPRGMEMKGTFRVDGSGPSWAYPVVVGGRLYLRYDTHLYCFNVKAK